jgi:hypothetical protein
LIAASMLVLSVSARAGAQMPERMRDTAMWHGWLSLALGAGSVNGRGRLAADASLWLTRGRLAVALRSADASRFLEPGDVGDVAVLAGIHPHTPRFIDVVLGGGVGMIGGRGTGGENLARRPAVAMGTQVMFDYRVIGLGIDGFAMSDGSRTVAGIGVAAAVGWFR